METLWAHEEKTIRNSSIFLDCAYFDCNTKRKWPWLNWWKELRVNSYTILLYFKNRKWYKTIPRTTQGHRRNYLLQNTLWLYCGSKNSLPLHVVRIRDKHCERSLKMNISPDTISHHYNFNMKNIITADVGWKLATWNRKLFSLKVV